jgi:hypothetical protein
MAFRIIEAVRRYTEPTLLGVVALGAVGAAGALIAYDLIHAHARTYPEVVAAAPIVAPHEKLSPAADQSVASVETAVQSRGEMSDVTLFQRVPVDFGDGRIYGVVTGLVYPNTRATTPARQYCYLQAGSVSASAHVTLNLASKDEAGAVETAKVDDADAKAVGLPLQRIKDSVASCRFV